MAGENVFSRTLSKVELVIILREKVFTKNGQWGYMSKRRVSAPKIIAIIVASGLALLLFPELVLLLAPQSGETVAFIWLAIATIAQLLGAFYLSVGIILGLWYLLVGALENVWPRYSIILTPITVAIGVPAVTLGILVAFGRRTGLQYYFGGFFVMTLPLVIGLLSKRPLDWRPIATFSVLLYLGFILLYFVGVPIGPMRPSSGPVLIDLVIPIGFILALYIVSGPLYFAGVRLKSATDAGD